MLAQSPVSSAPPQITNVKTAAVQEEEETSFKYEEEHQGNDLSDNIVGADGFYDLGWQPLIAGESKVNPPMNTGRISTRRTFFF